VQPTSIDELMEKASAALLATDYFKVEDLCQKAMNKARRARDFERLGRIVLPLQEARRQRRHEAFDTGHRQVLSRLADLKKVHPAGVYLLRPPIIGVEARIVRDVARRKKVPLAVLVREPRTASGMWPLVLTVPERSIRIQVAAPVTDEDTPPTAEWFMANIEALGDAAIRSLNPKDPAQWRVDDLLEFIDALPEHEKLHQRLTQECKAAMGEPEPEEERFRGYRGTEGSF
jgi:hypothetical protein